MTKLWDCRVYRSANYFAAHDPRCLGYCATTRNVPSFGLGIHGPDIDAIRAALPWYVRTWSETLWHTKAPIGKCVNATVKFYNNKSGKRYREITVYCNALEA